MKSRTSLLLPSADKIMKEFGNNMKLARLRRKLSVEQIAERAGKDHPKGNDNGRYKKHTSLCALERVA